MIWLAGVILYVAVAFAFAPRMVIAVHAQKKRAWPTITKNEPQRGDILAGSLIALAWPLAAPLYAWQAVIAKRVDKKLQPGRTLSALGEIGEKDKNMQAVPDWEGLYKQMRHQNKVLTQQLKQAMTFPTAPPTYSSVTTGIGGNSGSSTSH